MYLDLFSGANSQDVSDGLWILHLINEESKDQHLKALCGQIKIKIEDLHSKMIEREHELDVKGRQLSNKALQLNKNVGQYPPLQKNSDFHDVKCGQITLRWIQVADELSLCSSCLMIEVSSS